MSQGVLKNIKKKLTLQFRSIESAESILSSLRRDEVTPSKKVHKTPPSPVTDIDSNIRRLEKAQVRNNYFYTIKIFNCLLFV